MGFLLKFTLVTCEPVEFSSMTNLFQAACGVIGVVIAASDMPFEFDATMLNV